MRARDHTDRLLAWWLQHGIDRVDLATASTNLWVNYRAIALPAPEHLAWLRACNARHRDIYIRPARHHPWPHIFLDDLPIITARRLAQRYRSLIVHTSPRGGCHLHLITDRPCTENERHHLQRHLAKRHGADRAATAGAQYQRLPGMRNWKRNGSWINIIHHPASAPPLTVHDHLHDRRGDHPARQIHTGKKIRADPQTVDRTPSGKDWAYVCTRLERGDDTHDITTDLARRAANRQHSDPHRYAAYTVTKAHRQKRQQANDKTGPS